MGVLLFAYPGLAEEPVSDKHEIVWMRGSDSVIEGSTMTVVPPREVGSEHVLKAVFSFSTDVDIGEATVRLPASIFKDWEGNPVGNVRLDISAGNPTDPNVGSGQTYPFSYYVDEATHEVVIFNNRPLLSGFSMSVEVLYNVVSSLVDNKIVGAQDYYLNEDIQAKFQLAPAGGPVHDFVSNKLTMKYDTKADINFGWKNGIAYKVWEPTWGTAPADAGEYVYVRWEVFGHAGTDDSQPFNINIRETNAAGYPGELFAYSNYNDGFKLATMDEFNTHHQPYAEDVSPTAATTGSDHRNSWRTYVYYRYKLADVKIDPYYNAADDSYTFRNKARVEMVAKDGTVTVEDLVGSVTVVSPQIHYPPPGIVTGMKKNNWGASYGLMNYILDRSEEPLIVGNSWLDGGNFYLNNLVFNSWKLTQEGDSYAVNKVKIEIEDDTLYFPGISGYPTLPNTALHQGDYKINLIKFSGYTEYQPDDVTQFTHKAKAVADHTGVKVYAAYMEGAVPTRSSTKSGRRYEQVGTIYKRQDAQGQVFYEYAGNDGTSLTGKTLKIPLPPDAAGNGALGFRLDLESNSVYTTFDEIRMETQLLLSDRIYNRTSGLRQIYRVKDNLYNTAYARQYSIDENGNYTLAHQNGSAADHVLTFEQGETSLDKRTTYYSVDKGNARYRLDFAITLREEITYPDPSLDNILQRGLVKEQRNSVFYDLLHPGVTVDASTIQVVCRNLEGGSYSRTQCETRVELHENWQGSGRTMMIVYARVPEGTTNLVSHMNGGHHYVSSEMQLTYTQYNTLANVADNGSRTRNFAIYRSLDGSLSQGMVDASDYFGGYNAQSFGPDIAPLMHDIDGDGNPTNAPTSTKPTYYTHDYTGLIASELSINKAVSSPENPLWGATTQTTEGGDYTYRLRYQNGSTTRSKDIVFYDELETAFGSNPYWQGTFQGIDISQPRNKGVDVKVYYSTASGLDFGDRGDKDQHLDNHPELWSLTPPSDLSTVKAIAVDMRRTTTDEEYVLPRDGSLVVNVYMRAPVEADEAILQGHLAYNITHATSRKRDDIDTDFDPTVALERCNIVTVSLEDMKLDIDKESDPVTGTVTAPAPVQANDTILYRLTVTNDNLVQAAEKVRVEDVIPDGLTIDYNNITVMFNNNDATNLALLPAGTNPRAKLVSAVGDRHLIFEIGELYGKEIATITIPTTVEDVPGVPEKVTFINTARITQVFDLPFVVDGPTTYHDLVPLTIPVEGTKRLEGRELTAEDRFTFQLKEMSTGQIYRTVEALPQAGGQQTTYHFDPHLAFDKAGTYHYTIYELKGTGDSILYSQQVYWLTVEVVEDTATGRLKAQSMVYREDSATGPVVVAPVFNNSYETTSHTFHKRWDFPEGTVVSDVPDLQLRLYRDGAFYGDVVVVPEAEMDDLLDGRKTHTWTNLPKYKADGSGELSVYTSVEVVPPKHYQRSIGPDGTVINTYRPGTFSAAKRWQGRIPAPGELTVQLSLVRTILNDDSIYPFALPIDLVELDGIKDEWPDPAIRPDRWEMEHWTYEWNDLPATGLVNRPVTRLQEVPGQGEWVDGEWVPEMEEVTEWVEEYASYEYHVEERTVLPHYEVDTTASASRYISNKFVPTYADIEATKRWEGGPARDHKAVRLVLTRQSEGGLLETVEQPPLISGNPPVFTYLWSQLPEQDAANNYKPYVYTVAEADAVDGQLVVGSNVYTMSQQGMTFTNTYVPAYTEFVATKTWVNGPAGDHQAVPMVLTRQSNGGPVETVDKAPDITGTASPYTYTWTELPVLDANNGYRPYVYTVAEAGVENGQVMVGENVYDVSQQDNAITNTYVPAYTEFVATKTWDGGPATDHHAVALTLTRQSDSGPVETVDRTPDITGGAPAYTYTWTELPVLDAGNRYLPYVYAVSEAGVENGRVTVGDNIYTVSQQGSAITNTYVPAYTQFVATKTWDGGPAGDHQAVPLVLTRQSNGGPVETVERAPDITGGASPYTYTWTELPVLDAGNKYLPYVYTVAEAGVENGQVMVGENAYDVSQQDNAITNTYVPAYTQFVATKTWDGGPAGDHQAVPLVLTRQSNGGPVETVDKAPDIIGDAPAFTYTWTELPVLDANNKYLPYVYAVAEAGVENGRVTVNGNQYVVRQQGNHITNQYQSPPTTNDLLGAPAVGIKQLGPQGAALQAGDFTFVLEGEGVRRTAHNQMDGSFRFEPLPFTEARVHRYTIRELAESPNPLVAEYDGTVYQLEYHIGLNDARELVLLRTLLTQTQDRSRQPLAEPEAALDIRFVNRLQEKELPPDPPDPPEPPTDYLQLRIPLTATKTLRNGTLRAGDYSFELLDSGMKRIGDPVTNDANGLVVFPDRTFTRAVRYTYYIREIPGNEPGITYDPTLYKIIITTTPNADGVTLHHSIELLRDGVPYAGPIAFENQRVLPPTGDSQYRTVLTLALGAGLLLMAAWALRRRQMA